MKAKVLFLCVHNSARSQMAEAYLNAICPAEFSAESAGIEAGTINPLVVRAMAEEGIDLTGKATRSVFDVYRSGGFFDHVISMCDEAADGRCPVVLRTKERHHWPFPDPSGLAGTDDEKMAGLRLIRDGIKQRITEWCADRCPAAT